MIQLQPKLKSSRYSIGFYMCIPNFIKKHSICEIYKIEYESSRFEISSEPISGQPVSLDLYSRVPNNSTKEIRVPPCQISKT